MSRSEESRSRTCSCIAGSLLAAFLVQALTSCQTSPPLSETPYKSLSHRFELSAGAAALGNFDTELRLDSQNFNVGTFLDAETDLGLGSSATVGNVNAVYRINRRHRVDLSLQQIDRDGTRTLNDSIEVGGETIPAGSVTSHLDTTTLQTTYVYNFAVQERWEVGFTAGLNWTDLDIGIGVTGGQEEEVVAKVFAPVPQLGITGTYALSPKWRVGGAIQWLSIGFGEYQGATHSMRLNLDYDIIKNLGVGLGLLTYQADADVEGDEFAGILNYGYQGAFLYLRGML